MAARFNCSLMCSWLWALALLLVGGRADPRTQGDLLLGELANAPILRGIDHSDVSVQATCGRADGTRFKCAVPRAQFGISPAWANMSAPLVNLAGKGIVKGGCGKWPSASKYDAGNGASAIVLVDGSDSGGARCSLRSKAGKAAKAGFAAMLFVEGRAKAGKAADRRAHLALPVVVLKKPVARQLTAGSGGVVIVALKALGRDESGIWKTPTTMYQEGMRMLTAGRKLRDLLEEEGQIQAVGGGVAEGEFEIAVEIEDKSGVAQAKSKMKDVRRYFERAIMRFRASVTLEPRAHVAWHELSNALWEFSLLFPGERLTPLPPELAKLWSEGEQQRLAAKAKRTSKSTSNGKRERLGQRESAASVLPRVEAKSIVRSILDLDKFDKQGTLQLEYRQHCLAGAQPRSGGRLRVVTVATDPRPQLRALQQSVKNSGHELEVIGMGTTYPGLGLKIIAMAEWLPTVPDDEYVLLVDAYDVLFLQSAEDILQRFHQFCAPIVFGAETRCHPDTALTLVHPKRQPRLHGRGEGEQPFFYLNSGTYIGRADDIKRMFQHLAEDLQLHYNWGGADYRQVNDQRWFMRYWFRHHDDVVLDVHGEIFHTLHQVPIASFKEEEPLGSLHSNVTGSRPCVLHGNGKDGKDTINHFIRLFQRTGWFTRDGIW